MDERPSQIDGLPTGTKLLLILSAALLPLGLALAWAARDSLYDANNANIEASEEQGRAVARAIESLVARNALALSVAANGAFQDNSEDPCGHAAQSLAVTPAIANRFMIRDTNGKVLCAHGNFEPRREETLVAPGDIRLWVSPQDKAVDYRVGVAGGMATGDVTINSLRAAAAEVSKDIDELIVTDGGSQLAIIRIPSRCFDRPAVARPAPDRQRPAGSPHRRQCRSHDDFRPGGDVAADPDVGRGSSP